jgi:hypothetical protein
MKRANRKPGSAVTESRGRLMVFEDRPGGMPLPPKRNGKRTARRGTQQALLRDRLQSLARMIDNCVMLAHTLDSEALGDVIVLLRQARQNVIGLSNQ